MTAAAAHPTQWQPPWPRELFSAPCACGRIVSHDVRAPTAEMLTDAVARACRTVTCSTCGDRQRKAS